MNILPTITLFAISISTLAQTKPTCFEWAPGGNQTDWYCFQDSLFKHINRTHNQFSYGEGKLIETDDSLVFQYSDYLPKYRILESEIGEGDSVQILFSVIEFDTGQPVESVEVFVPRMRIGATTDSKGIGKVVLPKHEISNADKLKFGSITYGYGLVPLGVLKDYGKVKIEIWLSERVSFYNKKDRDSYVKLIKSERKLRLRNEYNYVYSFKLIDERRFNNIYETARFKR